MASSSSSKPRSRAGTSANSSAAPSRASSVGASSENRKARRKKKKQQEVQSNQAGPSNTTANSNDSGDISTSQDPEIESEQRRKIESSSLSHSKPSVAGEEFIPFEFDEESEDEKVEAEEEEVPEREWDKGKGRMREEHGSVSKKRKIDDVDVTDGYASKKQRLDAASRRAPWAWDVDWDSCHNVSEMLHREVEAFVHYISPTPVEDEVRSLIVDLVSKAVTEAFPDAQVLPFGSYETKLYLPLGDIDLVILSQSMAYSRTTSVLHAVANTVKRAGLTDKVTIIAKAKVPIIKFITRHGRFSVDISVNQSNGVSAGKIIKRFIQELPALRALVLIIKSFLSQRSMNEVFSGGLGSYSIVCLAISFLQMHPKIRRGEIDPMKNLGVLVMEFFELYGHYFNYQEVGISLRDGGSYFNKSQKGWLDYRAPGLLSIEDPGDPSNDISRGSFNIAKVKTTLAGAYGIMTSATYIHAEYINAKREHRMVRLRQDKRTPEDMSILASVMGVTQETVNHRKLVQEVYDSRALHRMLGVEPKISVSVSVDKEDGSNKKPTSKQTRAAKESVRSAWNAADANDSADEHETGNQRQEEEESRYGIVDQPPKKRQRTGTFKDMHTVYTTDDDDEEGGEVELKIHDGLSEEEAEYDVDVGESSPPSSGKRERTRSYWLSKGIVSGD